ncbi:MAG: IS256 family transposase [Candidatus Binatia bacterium]
MSRRYQIIGKEDREKLSEYLVRHGQFLLPMVELIERSRLAVDELIEVLGRASIEAVLRLSAQGVAGAKHRGSRGNGVSWHGSQGGKVTLSERRLRVKRPRLRRGRGRGGEVEIPAYEAMQQQGRLGERMLEILMRNVSTRNYEAVLPQMVETVGIRKSSVSREFVEMSGRELLELCERCFDGVELLIVYIDGLRFGEHHVIVGVGVDKGGQKHVLGIREGATENATVVSALLEELIERGVRPDRHLLFVIDGSKALRAAIDRVFGKGHLVQRCRNHKIKNVMDHLPESIKESVKAAMKAAYRLKAEEGMGRLEKQAEWLSVEYPDAAASLREGLEETFTINRLNLSPSLRRCLASTNIVENPHSGVRLRTRRVSRWRDGEMVKRWAAAALLAAEKNFRRILGYRDLWMLEAQLRSEAKAEEKAA